MRRDSIGSIRRMASIVRGASVSHRALKCRSPTSISRWLMAGGYVPENGAGTTATRPTISTHVLDTGSGRPAVGIAVVLSKLGEDGRPIRMTQALTDADGRVRDLLERPLAAGTYRLEFELART